MSDYSINVLVVQYPHSTAPLYTTV